MEAKTRSFQYFAVEPILPPSTPPHVNVIGVSVDFVIVSFIVVGIFVPFVIVAFIVVSSVNVVNANSIFVAFTIVASIVVPDVNVFNIIGAFIVVGVSLLLSLLISLLFLM